MKMMHPFSCFFASLNSCLTLLAPIPTNISWNSEAAALMNSQLASLASALANRVFPVPGGP